MISQLSGWDLTAFPSGDPNDAVPDEAFWEPLAEGYRLVIGTRTGDVCSAETNFPDEPVSYRSPLCAHLRYHSACLVSLIPPLISLLSGPLCPLPSSRILYHTPSRITPLL